jgi:hypothetical protein
VSGLALASLIPVLQTAVGPVIQISGVGLLLLTMTNRLGRTIERSRLLAARLPKAEPADRPAIEGQLRILWERSRLLRAGIVLVTASALSAALLVIVLFFSALFDLATGWLVGGLFVLCMACLIGSLAVFLREMNQSLAALKLELRGQGFTVGRTGAAEVQR